MAPVNGKVEPMQMLAGLRYLSAYGLVTARG